MYMQSVVCPQTALQLDALESLFLSRDKRKVEREACLLAKNGERLIRHYQDMSNDIECYPN